LFSGLRSPGDGAAAGSRNLGLELRRCDGRARTLTLTPPLDETVTAFDPQLLLWTDYPETEGRTEFPFHTKARNLARLLASRERLAGFDLAAPLPNAIDFEASAQTQQRVDAALAEFSPPGTRLAVISHRGVTAARKNWGDGSEARAFIAAMRRGSPLWRFVSMDGETRGDGVAGFRDVFGDIDEPFARLYKAFARRVELFVGIPAGPLHFMMARGGVPTVGLWLAHHPDWYDEPNPSAIHIVGAFVRERGFDRRAATTSKPPSLQHRLHYLDTRTIGADAVVDAVRRIT
jgi:hypothetical protein